MHFKYKDPSWQGKAGEDEAKNKVLVAVAGQELCLRILPDLHA